MRAWTTSLLILLIIACGAVAVPPVLRAIFELDSPAVSGALAVLWGVLWARIVVWGLRHRARLIGKTRSEREKATP